MIVPIVLVTLGMATPYLLRRLNARGPTALVVAAHLAGLLMIWTGLIDLVVGQAGLAHGLVEFCELALSDPPADGDPRGVVVMVGVLALLIGRAAAAGVRTVADIRRARAQLLRTATRVVDGVAYAPVGSVACTVGVVRPRVFVDRDMFPRLTELEQAAVLAHERGHLRGHGLVDLVARSLAAGLAPWPGAALAHREIRLHLEAMADDRAARRTSRRTVAGAIVAAATTPPRFALGATGWSAWRVERLLAPPPQRRLLAGMAAALIVLSMAAVAQTIGHAVAGLHLVPVAFPAV